MNIEQLKNEGLIFYETIVGSHAYNTCNLKSDIDIKGFYWVDPSEYLSLNPPVYQEDGQISDDNNDTTYYSLHKAFSLLKNANPNAIELLWMPEDCIQISNDAIMPILFENRKLFITKQAYYSHTKYAVDQIKKATGKNKKVHNPQPVEIPKKEDFCWIIPFDRDILKCPHRMPCRPISLKEIRCNDHRKTTNWDLAELRPNGTHDFTSGMDLSDFHISSVEHSHNVYRLYYYAEKAKGVFRGDDMLVCESIPKDEEHKCVGLLIYNQDEYNKSVKEWHSYWDWVKHRNSDRWKSQENKDMDYDCKNMQHCVRLIYSGMNILTDGEPIVRCEGELLSLLKDIRNEKFTYEELMAKLAILEKDMEKALELCNLPEQSDFNKVDKLYRHLMEVGSKVYN